MEEDFVRKDDIEVTFLKKHLEEQREIIKAAREQMDTIQKAKEQAEIEYFCGRVIIQEDIIDSKVLGKIYNLIIFLDPLMIKASVDEFPPYKGKISFSASIREIHRYKGTLPLWYKSKDCFNVTDFEEGKKIAIKYMKSMIEKYEATT